MQLIYYNIHSALTLLLSKRCREESRMKKGFVKMPVHVYNSTALNSARGIQPHYKHHE